MFGSWDLSRIADAFANAAVDSARWRAAVDEAAAVTGSVGAILLPVEGRQPPIPCSDVLSETTDTYFREGWAVHDERYRGLKIFKQRGVVSDLDFSTPDEIKNHPYYQEFLAPFGLRWAAVVKVQAGTGLWCLSIQRSIAQGPFSNEELLKLVEISPSLSGAASLSQALAFSKLDAATDAFDISGSAVLLLDRFGKVVRANAAAEAILGADLNTTSGRLISFDREATVALDRTLKTFLQTDNTQGSPPVVLPRRSGASVLAYFLRLPTLSADIFGPCKAVIVLVDTGKKTKLSEATLRTAFKLTTAEARLAARLAAGATLYQAADELFISKETARVQLKAIFLKTSTHRQAELIALLGLITNPRF